MNKDIKRVLSVVFIVVISFLLLFPAFALENAPKQPGTYYERHPASSYQSFSSTINAAVLTVIPVNIVAADILPSAASLIVAALAVAAIALVLMRYYMVNRNLQNAMRMTEERYEFVLDKADIVFVDFDYNRTVITYSDTALQQLDIPKDDANFHTNFWGCFHPDDFPGYLRDITKLYEGDLSSLIYEARLRTPSKRYNYFIIKAQSFVEPRGKSRVCSMLINIDDQRQLQLQVERTKNTDDLTGALNRGKFISDCDRALSGPDHSEYALICLDIDHLSTINNLCGYDAGDFVLQQAAEAVRACIDKDAIFGRLGNDDYALLVKSANKDAVLALFERISDTVAKTSVELLIRIPVRIHGGVAFIESEDNILSLLTKATAAQSIAKERGEGLVDYEQSVRFLTLDREELTEDLRNAYEIGALDIWYQPKIHLKTRRLVGHEALMRWKHPKKGYIPPSLFIELAEKGGFIDQLDVWAIKRACRQNKQWQEMGHAPVRVSVNVSKALFQRVDLVKTIRNLLEEIDLDPHYLDVELTESLAVHDTEKTVEVLRSLRELGVTVSMDDFGSGYASLGTLKLLPFDTLKIDRSLIMDIDKNETSQQIAIAIMNIARSINLNIVAEGAETAPQIEYLEKINCDVVQGYYFGKPVPADEFARNFSEFRGIKMNAAN